MHITCIIIIIYSLLEVSRRSVQQWWTVNCMDIHSYVVIFLNRVHGKDTCTQRHSHTHAHTHARTHTHTHSHTLTHTHTHTQTVFSGTWFVIFHMLVWDFLLLHVVMASLLATYIHKETTSGEPDSYFNYVMLLYLIHISLQERKKLSQTIRSWNHNLFSFKIQIIAFYKNLPTLEKKFTSHSIVYTIVCKINSSTWHIGLSGVWSVKVGILSVHDTYFVRPWHIWQWRYYIRKLIERRSLSWQNSKVTSKCNDTLFFSKNFICDVIFLHLLSWACFEISNVW